MAPRSTHPARLVPGAMPALLALGQSTHDQGVPSGTLHLVHLRASQINGCELCLELHAKELADEGDAARIDAVAGWFQSEEFTPAERTALALTEAVTRLADHGHDAVSDDLWAEVNRHYDERAVAALLVSIASVNVWNRLNAATHQDMSAFAA